MDTDLAVARVAGAVAIGSAIYTTVATSRRANQEQEFRAKTDAYLEVLRHDLDAAVRQEDRSLKAREVIDQHRRPLLASAVELNRRLGNIRANHFLSYLQHPGHRADVALLSTLYRFAAFLGWREILARKLTYLDYEDSSRTKQALERLERVSAKLATSSLDRADGHGPTLMLWKDEQRAVGGLMCRADGDGVLGFESFFEQYDSTFAPWLQPFAEDLRRPDVEGSARLEAVSMALADLIEALDEKSVYRGRV